MTAKMITRRRYQMFPNASAEAMAISEGSAINPKRPDGDVRFAARR
jgi:hypothetical protein